MSFILPVASRLTLCVVSQVEGLAEQVGVEHPRKLISFTLTGEFSALAECLFSNLLQIWKSHSINPAADVWILTE